jgi:hypothetical protein
MCVSNPKVIGRRTVHDRSSPGAISVCNETGSAAAAHDTILGEGGHERFAADSPAWLQASPGDAHASFNDAAVPPNPCRQPPAVAPQDLGVAQPLELLRRRLRASAASGRPDELKLRQRLIEIDVLGWHAEAQVALGVDCEPFPLRFPCASCPLTLSDTIYPA